MMAGTQENNSPALFETDTFQSPITPTCGMLGTSVGRLRFAKWMPPKDTDTRGTVVLAHGLSEHIEKYYEVVDNLVQRGLAVAMADWLGHGGSDKCPAERKEDFAAYDEGFASFMQQQVIGMMPSPIVGIGHSMGGCLVCCAARDHPEWFAGCVLSSPMLGVKAVEQSRFLVHVGKGLAKMPDMVRKKVNERKKFDGRFTSDKTRYERHQKMLSENPSLAPRYDFVHWFNSMNARISAMREKGWYSSITTPMLILVAGDETLVDNAAAIAAASEIQNVELEIINEAWHELLMEKDTIQIVAWSKIDEFLDIHAPPKIPAKPAPGTSVQSKAAEDPKAPEGEPEKPDPTPNVPGKLVMKLGKKD